MDIVISRLTPIRPYVSVIGGHFCPDMKRVDANGAIWHNMHRFPAARLSDIDNGLLSLHLLSLCIHHTIVAHFIFQRIVNGAPLHKNFAECFLSLNQIATCASPMLFDTCLVIDDWGSWTRECHQR